MSVPVATRKLMPNGHIYMSPTGLRHYQAEAAARLCLDGELIVLFDTGLGKTHCAMAAAGFLFESDSIDLVIFVGERGKIAVPDEHPQEWATFTSLRQLVYHGPTRMKRLGRDGIPDVLLTTYDTAASELMRRVDAGTGKRSKGKKVDGPLFELLGLRKRRILWVFDEISILSSRGAERYRAWEYTITQLRKTGNTNYFLGLTGNSMKTTEEDSFNQARLVSAKIPNITTFESEFTRGRDLYGRLIMTSDGRIRFAQLFQGISYRKRLTDADVKGEVPEPVHRPLFIDMHPEHRKFYDAVNQMYDPQRVGGVLPEEYQRAVNTALHLTANHPASHLHSDSPLSRAIVQTMGEETLRAIPNSKLLRLVEDKLRPIVDEGHQVLLYTFYAETVLPELERDLIAAGFTVATYTSGMSAAQATSAKQAFRSGKVQILLSSDAGARGLNLPEATYIISYEPARTIEIHIQRIGRGTRLGSENPFVFGTTAVLRGTIDESGWRSIKERGKHKDQLLGDDDRFKR